MVLARFPTNDFYVATFCRLYAGLVGTRAIFVSPSKAPFESWEFYSRVHVPIRVYVVFVLVVVRRVYAFRGQSRAVSTRSFR